MPALLQRGTSWPCRCVLGVGVVVSRIGHLPPCRSRTRTYVCVCVCVCRQFLSDLGDYERKLDERWAVRASLAPCLGTAHSHTHVSTCVRACRRLWRPPSPEQPRA